MFRTASVAACAALLSACSMLAGLDQISESACAPNCGADAATGDEVSTPDADGSTADRASSLADQGLPEALAGDSASSDGPGPSADAVSEAPPLRDSSADTSDTPPDASDAGSCGTVYFSDSFADNSQGWSLDTSWSVASTCSSPPAPQKGNPDPTVDHTTGQAGGIAGAFVCGNNPAGQQNAVRYLTSPAIDVSAAPAVILTFYRWLNSDAAAYMTSTVDVFDGTTWVNVYANPSGSGTLVADAAWTKQQYDVTAHRSATFRVRFGYATLSKSVYSMSCWNVDDVTVSSTACQ